MKLSESTVIRRLPVLSMVVAMVAMIAMAAALLVAVNDDDTWSPLGPFPEQQVITTDTYLWESTETAAGTTERIPLVTGDTVIVEGTKCNQGEVLVSGSKSWTFIEPPGFTFEDGAGTGVRPDGCSTRTFVNDIPPEVIEQAADKVVVLRIGGCETPTDPDKGEGETLCWRTEPFAIGR